MAAVKQMLELYAYEDSEQSVRDAALQTVRILFGSAKEEEVVAKSASSAVPATMPETVLTPIKSNSFVARATRSLSKMGMSWSSKPSFKEADSNLQRREDLL